MNATKKNDSVFIWPSGETEEKKIAPEETEKALTELIENPPKIKRRRRSLIDKEPLPEPKQRKPRKKKDPILKKTHSFTVLMTEQLYQRFKMTAQQQEYSMNGIVNRLIKKYVFLHDVDSDDDIGI